MVTQRLYLKNRPVFLHSYSSCSELPSDVSTMIKITILSTGATGAVRPSVHIVYSPCYQVTIFQKTILVSKRPEDKKNLFQERTKLYTHKIKYHKNTFWKLFFCLNSLDFIFARRFFYCFPLIDKVSICFEKMHFGAERFYAEDQENTPKTKFSQ